MLIMIKDYTKNYMKKMQKKKKKFGELYQLSNTRLTEVYIVEDEVEDACNEEINDKEKDGSSSRHYYDYSRGLMDEKIAINEPNGGGVHRDADVCEDNENSYEVRVLLKFGLWMTFR